jgi:hypothetical protein
MNVVALLDRWPVALVWLAAYLVAVLGSGPVVRALFRLAGVEPDAAQARPGAVIGKLEDVLVVTFVAANAYTALALVFAAKNIARRVESEADERKASYYILGTLANFTWALLIALLAAFLTRHGLQPAGPGAA